MPRPSLPPVHGLSSAGWRLALVTGASLGVAVALLMGGVFGFAGALASLAGTAVGLALMHALVPFVAPRHRRTVSTLRRGANALRALFRAATLVTLGAIALVRGWTPWVPTLCGLLVAPCTTGFARWLTTDAGPSVGPRASLPPPREPEAERRDER